MDPVGSVVSAFSAAHDLYKWYTKGRDLMKDNHERIAETFESRSDDIKRFEADAKRLEAAENRIKNFHTGDSKFLQEAKQQQISAMKELDQDLRDFVNKLKEIAEPVELIVKRLEMKKTEEEEAKASQTSLVTAPERHHHILRYKNHLSSTQIQIRHPVKEFWEREDIQKLLNVADRRLSEARQVFSAQCDTFTLFQISALEESSLQIFGQLDKTNSTLAEVAAGIIRLEGDLKRSSTKPLGRLLSLVGPSRIEAELEVSDHEEGETPTHVEAPAAPSPSPHSPPTQPPAGGTPSIESYKANVQNLVQQMRGTLKTAANKTDSPLSKESEDSAKELYTRVLHES